MSTTSTDEKTLEALTQEYIANRDRIAKASKRLDEMLAPIRERQKLLEAQGLATLRKMGMNSASGTAGVAYRSIKKSYKVENWDEFAEFLHAQDAKLDMVDRKPNKTAMKEYYEQHGKLPPGVAMTVFETANFRR